MIAWSDVTAWTTMWAPTEGDAITAAVLAQVQDANAKQATVFSSQYSFTDAGIAQAMGDNGAANQASRFLFDKSQYSDSHEQPLVEDLIARLRSDQWGIGTSPVGDNILHSKIVAILYPDGTGWTFSGSFNLSDSAQAEFNIADLIWSRARAEAFAAQIQEMLTFVQTHQPQPPERESQ